MSEVELAPGLLALPVGPQPEGIGVGLAPAHRPAVNALPALAQIGRAHV